MARKKKLLWTEQYARVDNPRGRICKFPKCPTKLSVYNDSEFCAAHDPKKIQVKHR